MAEHKLTVVQILPALESGGVERGTLEVAAALVHAGHRSIVVSAGGRLVDTLVAAGSEHIKLPVGKKSLLTLFKAHQLRRILRQERVDILHARSRMPAWVAWLALRGMPVGNRPRFVTTVHGLYSVNRYSRIMTRGDCVIAVSDSAHKYIIDHYPDVDPKRITTIYRGVDRNEFPYGYKPNSAWVEEWYRAYPFLRDRQVLTLPGRLTRLKGHEDFIELIGMLVDKGLPVHGLVVGHLDHGRYKYIEELKRKISSSGLADTITFTGQRTDIKDIYAVSDMILSLSNKPESFGRTVLEALYLGVPAVGYDYGGVGEILGRLYPSGRVPVANMPALIESVSQLLENPLPVKQKNMFDLETMLGHTIDIYERLADEYA